MTHFTLGQVVKVSDKRPKPLSDPPHYLRKWKSNHFNGIVKEVVKDHKYIIVEACDMSSTILSKQAIGVSLNDPVRKVEPTISEDRQMLSIGQSVKVEYIGGLPPDDIHDDLKDWWVRDYSATILSINNDSIIVKDTDASEDWVDCIYTIWSSDKTVSIVPLN